MALVSRVIEQAVDPGILRESLRSELARLAEDDADVSDSPLDTDARDMKRAIVVTQGLISAHRGNPTPLRTAFSTMRDGESLRVITALANLWMSEMGERVGAENVEVELAEALAVYTAVADQLDAADEQKRNDDE